MLAALVLGVPALAQAQFNTPGTGMAPSTGTGMAPSAVAPAAASSPPRVTLCLPNDVRGLWKLRRVFETPEGAWSEDFRRYPHQYRQFAPQGGLYRETKGDRRYARREGLVRGLEEATRNTMQYVVGEKGAVYFYKDGKHASTMYCGIVREDKPPYYMNEMVLTPASGNNTTSIYLLYRRPFAPPPGQPNMRGPGGPRPNPS